MSRLGVVLGDIDWVEYGISPRDDDCVSVAVGISRVVDIDRFVGVFDPIRGGKPLHLTVEKDGVLFDGKGVVGDDYDVLLDYLGFLRVRDFPGDVNSPSEIYKYEIENGIVVFDDVRGVLVRSMDEGVVEDVVDVLKEELG